jgi:competence protein ComEC
LFIDSGLVHLVAVSGGNIVMLVTFLTAILFFIPFYARITLILLAVLSYGVICGMDSSVLRAVLMGSLSLVALLVGRGSSLRRLLGLVYIGMLMYNPYFLVYDVGFILSFSAVL